MSGQTLGALPLALHMAQAVLAGRAGVSVLGEWAPTETPTGRRWGLPVRLPLVGAAATEHVAVETDWVVTAAPDGDVRLYPALGDGALTVTFPHQNYNGDSVPGEANWDVRCGDLCTTTSTHALARTRTADYDEPKDAYARVLWHVDRACVWLRDAATGELVRDGDPFELPDFRTPGHAGGCLAVYEDRASLEKWSAAPRAGVAETCVVGSPAGGARVVRAWLDGKSEDVLRPSWGTYVSERKAAGNVLWVRLDALPVRAPWQAPATGEELLAAAAAQGIDVLSLLRSLWKHVRGQGVSFLLVGAPIPERQGGAPSVMHWQALRLPTLGRDATRTQRRRAHESYPRLLDTGAPLCWVARTENWHPDVVENRGRLSLPLRAMRIVLVGTGALGALLADALVRMGVCELMLVDPDRYEAGNGVRHRLGLPDIGYQKAPALAARLNAVLPSARVRGIAASLPTRDKEVRKALAAADLVLDCTASDQLTRDLAGLGLSAGARIVSASVGLHAEQLYLFGDRADAFTADAFDAWFGPYRHKEHGRAVAEGLPQAAGCWHPVTPVPYHRLLRQVGVLAERLEELAAQPVGRVAEALGAEPASLRVAA